MTRTAATSSPSGLALLFAMEVCAGISRGSYLVCIGWTTLVVTGDVSRVGQVFIVAMLAMLLGGPLIGTLVDRRDRRSLIISAHLFIAAVMAALALFWVPAATPSVAVLFAAVALLTLFRVTHHFAHDGLIQSIVAKDEVMRWLARFRGVHLMSTALGTVLSGVIIDQFSPAAGFWFSGFASVALTFPMWLFRGAGRSQVTKKEQNFLLDMLEGAALFRRKPNLALLALLAAACLPIAQLSNAILSSLIHDDLGLGSDVFGLVDSAWPLGGMVAALVLGSGARLASWRYMEFLAAIAAGLFTIALALAQSVPLLVLAHGGMGVCVWMCRIVIDSRLLAQVDDSNVGRAKAGVEMAFSLAALTMCLSPTVISLPATADYFTFWGAAMIGVAALVFALSVMRR